MSFFGQNNNQQPTSSGFGGFGATNNTSSGKSRTRSSCLRYQQDKIAWVLVERLKSQLF